jgi:Peptidase family M28
MGAAETIASLASFERRGAGTNAERRAALWLGAELRTPRRDAILETFWCRPSWAMAHAWHVGLALLGSLVSVASPKVGGALILVGLLSLALDALAGVSLGRRLSPERASQNVVSRNVVGQNMVSQTSGEAQPVTLIITANYDAGRAGVVYRSGARRLAARLRTVTGARTPGWQGWLTIAFVWVLVTAILRDGGAAGHAIGVAQLVPTAALVLALALLVELASSEHGPAAGDNASGVALALALARALDVAPPRRLGVEVVLQGASDGTTLGLSRHLRTRRRELTAANTVVLGIGACGEGNPCWWTSDGSLVPLRFTSRLGQIAEHAAGPTTELGAVPHRGRGTTPALAARFAGLPAITIGCLDGDGLAPRSHQTADVPEALDRGSIDRLLELALTLVDAIDADLSRAVTTGRSGADRAAA